MPASAAQFGFFKRPTLKTGGGFHPGNLRPPMRPSTGMALCVKGRYGLGLSSTATERLTGSPIRDETATGGKYPGFREATWDEALDLVRRN